MHTQPAGGYPQRVHTTRRRVYATPGRVYATPGRVYATPGRVYATPGRVHARCGRVSATCTHDASAGTCNTFGAGRGRLQRGPFLSTVSVTWPVAASRTARSSAGQSAPPRFWEGALSTCAPAGACAVAVPERVHRRGRAGGQGTCRAPLVSAVTARRSAPCAVGGHEILPGGGHVAARWRPAVLPSGGQRFCPLAASGSARRRPAGLPALKSVSRGGLPRRGAFPTRMAGRGNCDHRAAGASEGSRGNHGHVGSVRPDWVVARCRRAGRRVSSRRGPLCRCARCGRVGRRGAAAQGADHRSVAADDKGAGRTVSRQDPRRPGLRQAQGAGVRGFAAHGAASGRGGGGQLSLWSAACASALDPRAGDVGAAGLRRGPGRRREGGRVCSVRGRRNRGSRWWRRAGIAGRRRWSPVRTGRRAPSVARRRVG